MSIVNGTNITFGTANDSITLEKFLENANRKFIANQELNIPFVRQGWQCPVCGRIYSPDTLMCYYCSNLTLNNTCVTGINKDILNSFTQKKEGDSN